MDNNNISRTNRTIDRRAEHDKVCKYGLMGSLSIALSLATVIPTTNVMFPTYYMEGAIPPKGYGIVISGLIAASTAISIFAINKIYDMCDKCNESSADVIEGTDIEMATVTANRLASIPTQAVTEVYRDNTHQVVESINNEELSKFTTNRNNLSLSNKLDTSNNVSSKKDNTLIHNVSYAL